MISTLNHYGSYGVFSRFARCPGGYAFTAETRTNRELYFNGSALLCWRSDLVHVSLRTYFLNTLRALHLIWIGVRNHKSLAFIGFSRNLLSQANDVAYAHAFRHHGLKRDNLPRFQRSSWWRKKNPNPVHVGPGNGPSLVHNGKLRLNPSRPPRTPSVDPRLSTWNHGDYTWNVSLKRVLKRKPVTSTGDASSQTKTKPNLEAAQHQRLVAKLRFSCSRANGFLLRDASPDSLSNPELNFGSNFNHYAESQPGISFAGPCGSEQSRGTGKHRGLNRTYGLNPSPATDFGPSPAQPTEPDRASRVITSLNMLDTEAYHDDSSRIRDGHGLNLRLHLNPRAHDQVSALASRTTNRDDDRNGGKPNPTHRSPANPMRQDHSTTRAVETPGQVQVRGQVQGYTARYQSKFETMPYDESLDRVGRVLPRHNVYLTRVQHGRYARFVANPNLGQADLVYFANPHKTPGLAKQARTLRLPAMGLTSGLKPGPNPRAEPKNPDVPFYLLGNPENPWLAFNVMVMVLRVGLKA